jgi:hypothetical protein
LSIFVGLFRSTFTHIKSVNSLNITEKSIDVEMKMKTNHSLEFWGVEKIERKKKPISECRCKSFVFIVAAKTHSPRSKQQTAANERRIRARVIQRQARNDAAGKHRAGGNDRWQREVRESR